MFIALTRQGYLWNDFITFRFKSDNLSLSLYKFLLSKFLDDSRFVSNQTCSIIWSARSSNCAQPVNGPMLLLLLIVSTWHEVADRAVTSPLPPPSAAQPPKSSARWRRCCSEDATAAGGEDGRSSWPLGLPVVGGREGGGGVGRLCFFFLVLSLNRATARLPETHKKSQLVSHDVSKHKYHLKVIDLYS